jgi:hypothetical protein
MTTYKHACPLDDADCPSPEDIDWQYSNSIKHIQKVHKKDKLWLAEHGLIHSLPISVDYEAYKLLHDEYQRNFTFWATSQETQGLPQYFAVPSIKDIASRIIKEAYKNMNNRKTDEEGS